MGWKAVIGAVVETRQESADYEVKPPTICTPGLREVGTREFSERVVVIIRVVAQLWWPSHG